MKLLLFKFAQTLGILAGWAVCSLAAALAGPVFLGWASLGALAKVWAFDPRRARP
jgi:hypothetical protein